MARKSKGFSDLLHQERIKSMEQQGMEVLASRSKDGPLKNNKIVTNPEGEVKMSGILEGFAAPYLEYVESSDQQKQLLGIAIIAWNLALMPAKKRKKEKNAFLTIMCEDLDSQLSEEARTEFRRDTSEILDDLIERKLTWFKNNQRRILDYEIQEARGQLHLSVMSTR